MAYERLSMTSLRQLLLLANQGKTRRSMMEAAGLSRRTVDGYMARFNASEFGFNHLLSFSDDELRSILYPQLPDSLKNRDPRQVYMQNNLDKFFKDLSRKHVTRQLIWEEYREKVSDGYSYTQFCQYLSEHGKMRQASMIQHYAPGEVMEIDFAGDKIPYVDLETGELINCVVLVMVLPFSGLLFVIALPDGTQAQLGTGLNSGLGYFGGVTRSVKTDNMSQLVSKADRYDPTFTEFCQQWACHYSTAMMAARVARPRDKAKVENGVRLAYYRIFAPLRNQTFTSLMALNQAILEKVNAHNDKCFQNRDYSRRTLFENEERIHLADLPKMPFDMFWVTKSKVARNYHVTVGKDMHYYSVPYQLIGKYLSVQYTADTVEIYHGQERVAFHKRSMKRYGYTTLGAHMPSSHKGYELSQQWDEQYFLNEAQKVGPMTHSFVKRMLSGRTYSEQAFNACKGLLRLQKKYSPLRLEAACQRMSESATLSYKVVENILSRGLDALSAIPLTTEKILPNDNIRGSAAYF